MVHSAISPRFRAPQPPRDWWRRSNADWRFANNIIVVFAAVALIAACVILSYSVLGPRSVS